MSPIRSWATAFRLAVIGLDVVAVAVIAVAVVVSGGRVPAWRTASWVAVSFLILWPLLLSLVGAYSSHGLGAGSEYYRRVGQAGLGLLAVVGVAGALLPLDLPRGFVLIVLPVLVVATIGGRWMAQQQLARLRATGRCVRRVVVVGRGGSVLDLVAHLGRDRAAGLQVVAACVPGNDRERVRMKTGLVVGGLDDVLALATEHGVETVAVTSASETAATYLRRLAWQLEGTGLELLVAPGLVDVAGPRLHIRTVEGLPLLAVEQPQFEGWRHVVKGTVDRVAAAVALLVVSPVLLGIAAAVRLSGPGPVFFRQERVGQNGRPFTMLKYRSMVVEADRQLEAIRALNMTDGLLFKMREDPRVTPVGRWLRRLSLDELPQLFNVLGGSMSLVGPRPPLPSEVAQYDSSVSRRLLVKPGLTGLWQVSGRSDLSWEESIRLDLRYVENWSLALDLLILWKTVAAVVRSQGAY